MPYGMVLWHVNISLSTSNNVREFLKQLQWVQHRVAPSFMLHYPPYSARGWHKDRCCLKAQDLRQVVEVDLGQHQGNSEDLGLQSLSISNRACLLWLLQNTWRYIERWNNVHSSCFETDTKLTCNNTFVGWLETRKKATTQSTNTSHMNIFYVSTLNVLNPLIKCTRAT